MRREKSRSHAWLYAELNKEAKAWWYHKKLREMGQHEEARKRERESIKFTLRTIRSGKLIIVSRAGSISILMSDNETVTAYDTEFYLRVMPRCVPVVDLRGETPEDIVRAYILAVAGPMPSTESREIKEEYGPFDYAPMHIYLALAESLGAYVRWGHLAGMRQIAMAQVDKTFPIQSWLEKIEEAGKEVVQ